MTKTSPTPQANLAAKSALARLMAAENINVQINAKAPTAMFDVQNRTLTLPLWEVDNDAYDMLVGHEVSHALYTPEGADSLWAACDRIDPKNRAVAKDYLNVVEDARIERLIKADYPGLRRSFAAGYREFMKRDLFGVAKKLDSLASLPLIDRVNLHYKIGWFIPVPFTDAELPLVRQVAETRTWDEVVDLSKALYDLARQQEQDKNQDKNQDQDQDQDDQDQDQEDGDGDSSDASEKSEGEETTQAQESDSGEETPSDKGADAETTQDGGDSKGEGTAEGEENDEDDGSTAEGSDSKSAARNGNPSTGGEDIAPPSGSETQRNLEKGLSDLAKISNNDYLTIDLPTPPPSMIVPIEKIENHLNNDKLVPAAQLMFDAWKTSNIGNVQALATEFERRKAADAHRRTVLSDTGSLDPTRLHAYKVSDDIFLRSSTILEGKNHGIVLLLDMSGSMSGIIYQTVVQLVNLVAFARRVNVPFKVYGFIDTKPTICDDKVGWDAKTPNTYRTLQDSTTRLLTLFESGMNQKRFQVQAGHLLRWSFWCSGRQRGVSGQNKESQNAFKQGTDLGAYPLHDLYAQAGLRLNGTPLNTALLALTHLVPTFKKANNLQIVNTVVLTDGEAADPILAAEYFSDGSSDKSPFVTIRDPVTRREYRCYDKNRTEMAYYRGFNINEQTNLISSILRDRTGSKIICIDLVSGARDATHRIEQHLGTYTSNAARRRWMTDRAARLGEQSPQADWDKGDAMKKEFNKNGFITLDNPVGYDVRIILDAGIEEQADTFENLVVDKNSKQGLRDLQKAFKKSLDNRRTNRSLMTQIAELISKNL